MTERLPDARALAERLAERLRGTGGRVFIPGGPAEPLALADAYAAEPERARGLTLVGVWIPGLNRTDWAGLHPDARAETIFAAPDWRTGRESGRLAVLPLRYSQAWRWLATTPLDAVVHHVSLPDARGLCSYGVSADFGPAVLGRAALHVALVNPAMPRTVDGPTAPMSAIDWVVEDERALASMAFQPPDVTMLRVAELVATLVPDGATVQVGVGKLGPAVLAALAGHRRLRVHSGLVTAELAGLLDGGAIEDAPGAVITGLALGDPAFQARVAADPRVRFAPVAVTHDFATLAALPRFAALNSAVEVDFYGQADIETVEGRPVSGIGGAVDFLRGAHASVGGLPVVALPSTARGGSVSRIVPRLASGRVSIARADMGLVVTEHGVADLRERSEDARAAALIAVAAPEHRETLVRAWVERPR